MLDYYAMYEFENVLRTHMQQLGNVLFTVRILLRAMEKVSSAMAKVGSVPGRVVGFPSVPRNVVNKRIVAESTLKY
jgi:hypothetical protein